MNKLLSTAEKLKRENKPEEGFRVMSSLIDFNNSIDQLIFAAGISALNYQGDAFNLLFQYFKIDPDNSFALMLMAQSAVSAGKPYLALLCYEYLLNKSQYNRYNDFYYIKMFYLNLLKQMKEPENLILRSMRDIRLNELKNLPYPKTADLLITLNWAVKEYNGFYILEPNKQICSVDNSKTKNGGIFEDKFSALNSSMYYIHNAPKGKYSIKINYNENSYYKHDKNLALITVYRNWGRKNQTQTIYTRFLNKNIKNSDNNVITISIP